MTITTWFPTSIYYAPLTDGEMDSFNEELARECYQIKEFDEQGQEWSKKHYVGGYTSHASIPELHKMSSTFADLEEKISQHVGQFVDHLEMDLGAGRLEMCDFWLNIMPSQTTHSMHLHPLSVISGTYYVQTPENAAGIKFEDPRLDRFMAAPPRRADCRAENRLIAQYEASAGNVVLFESWLRHEVSASITSEDRISVSFNYHWVE